MGDRLVMVDRYVDAVVAVEREARSDLRPTRLRDRVVAPADLDLGAGRIIAGEVPGIDLEAGDDSGHPEADHAPVMARRSLAPALPAVHPLAVLVIFAGNEHGLGRFDQAGLVGEEIVGRIDHLAPEPGLGEIDVMAAQVLKHAGARSASGG